MDAPGITPARHYDPQREVLRLMPFVSDAEQDALLAWAFRMRPYLQNNGPGRHFLRVHLLPEQSALHGRVAERVRRLVAGQSPHALEPVLTNYLSIISAGGAVQPHTDSAPSGTRHLRCNLFLQFPERGARPVIAEQPIAVAEQLLLCFFPSSYLHWSEPVAEARERVLLSFGLLVPEGFRLDPAHAQGAAV